MQWQIDDVPIYIAIVENRGITAAAARLQLSKSAVSKALSRLENALGVRLLDRNTRNLRITSEGEAFYRSALLIMEQVEEANSKMAGLTNEPSGQLTVALPMAFSREIVAPHLGQFHRQYPRIKLELIVSGHTVDIIREQIDIAVVVGALADSELVARKLYSGRLLCVTSPRYAREQALGHTLEDMISHVKICEKRYAEKRIAAKIRDRAGHIDLRQCPLKVNDPIAVREAVVNGCGVALVPDQYCRAQLESGELVRVFDELHIDAAAAALSAVYPGRRLISNRTRVFLDFLDRLCRQI